MKCDQVVDLLTDFHYGELDSQESAGVEEHLRQCSSCRNKLEAVERETRVFAAYAADTERSMELTPDLWKRASEARRPATHFGRPALLRNFGASGAWLRQAIAAMLLIAVSVTGTLMYVHYRERGMQPPAIGDKSLSEALNSIQKAEQEYLRAIQQLNALVDKQKSTLDPRVVTELETSLRMIDEHIAATRQAYYTHPEDAELAIYMLAAYSRKVELLQDLTSS